ncbi:hypothetical protein DFA_03735 [Cavenderia fasciculata]|uniref:Uncharacterized protein n=1 Tax=Cavenderia fasciculata TaxID=261658 RepID=F4Q097_CACFS|nr:uncharacterized protein DFA_03735 [Cavenderia fasciculata]EGG18248.1 hypothetical protein DFA_03735 [Cavenderia fasciculata]|eukprot:XP_004357071.1 hypothetical protein DFA_03735 [Cavenderia fasciculata]
MQIITQLLRLPSTVNNHLPLTENTNIINQQQEQYQSPQKQKQQPNLYTFIKTMLTNQEEVERAQLILQNESLNIPFYIGRAAVQAQRINGKLGFSAELTFRVREGRFHSMDEIIGRSFRKEFSEHNSKRPMIPGERSFFYVDLIPVHFIGGTVEAPILVVYPTSKKILSTNISSYDECFDEERIVLQYLAKIESKNINCKTEHHDYCGSSQQVLYIRYYNYDRDIFPCCYNRFNSYIRAYP